MAPEIRVHVLYIVQATDHPTTRACCLQRGEEELLLQPKYTELSSVGYKPIVQKTHLNAMSYVS